MGLLSQICITSLSQQLMLLQRDKDLMLVLAGIQECKLDRIWLSIFEMLIGEVWDICRLRLSDPVVAHSKLLSIHELQ